MIDINMVQIRNHSNSNNNIWVSFFPNHTSQMTVWKESEGRCLKSDFTTSITLQLFLSQHVNRIKITFTLHSVIILNNVFRVNKLSIVSINVVSLVDSYLVYLQDVQIPPSSFYFIQRTTLFNTVLCSLTFTSLYTEEIFCTPDCKLGLEFFLGFHCSLWSRYLSCITRYSVFCNPISLTCSALIAPN